LLFRSLVEAVVVAAAGGIAALIVAAWIDSALASFELPGRVAIAALRPALDGRLIGAAVALTVVAALLCGLAPALAGVRGDLLSVMRRETTASPRMRTARTLVAVQVAICLVLVFGCSLFVRAVSSAMAIDVGFDPHHLIVVASNPWSNGYDTGRSRRYLSALLDRVRTLPGVVAAASGTPPLTNALSMATPVVRIDGTQVGPTSVAMSATAPAMVYVSVVSGDYFSTIGQRLAAGRDFGGADSAASEPVAIVSESAARRFWPGQNPVGRHIGFQPLTADATVVGIARDVRYANLLDDQRACVYLPVAQAPGGLGLNAPIVIRTASAFSSADVYRAAADIDPSLPVADLRSVDEYMARLLMPQRLGTSLLGLLGAVALAVTIVGVYGLIACGVARSRREVGIRMALGADRRDILGHTCARAVVPVAIGVVGGCAASLWAGRFADRFMYGIRGTDPTSLIAAAVLLLTAAGVAALLPAMRATRIDPVEALRAD
jgi:predicted permease